jgi:putative ABC transport system substrate-binding protein
MNFSKKIRSFSLIALIINIIPSFTTCTSPKSNKKQIPVIGFLDFIQDPTVQLARDGFFDALKKNGFSEVDSTIEIIYSNAQGYIPTLGQACDHILSKKPDLIATNVTLSTITAVQRTKDVPVFMMVAPRPDIAGLSDNDGKAPANLSGVYETLDYIDTAVTIINQLYPYAKKIGTVYNQSEPQSVDAFEVLQRKCKELGLELVSLPVNNSSETQLVIMSLLNKKIDAFFALPDNVIFASFETIVKSCSDAAIPIFTSEAGLVSRGAAASFGADFYQWGFQSGILAAQVLKSGKQKLPQPEIVKARKKIYNPEVVARFGIQPGADFSPMK